MSQSPYNGRYGPQNEHSGERGQRPRDNGFGDHDRGYYERSILYARDGRENRRTRDDYKWARSFLANLRFCLEAPELEHETRQLLAQAVAGELAPRLYAIVSRRIFEEIRDGSILVEKRSHKLGLSTLSFSSLHPEWEEKVKDWIFDLIGPTLDELYQTKRARRK